MEQQPAAADVLLQHATNAMLAHATDVAVLRIQLQAANDALGAAFAAMHALETKAEPIPSVPGYAEWQARRGAAA